MADARVSQEAGMKRGPDALRAGPNYPSPETVRRHRKERMTELLRMAPHERAKLVRMPVVSIQRRIDDDDPAR